MIKELHFAEFVLENPLLPIQHKILDATIGDMGNDSFIDIWKTHRNEGASSGILAAATAYALRNSEVYIQIWSANSMATDHLFRHFCHLTRALKVTNVSRHEVAFFNGSRIRFMPFTGFHNHLGRGHIINRCFIDDALFCLDTVGYETVDEFRMCMYPLLYPDGRVIRVW